MQGGLWREGNVFAQFLPAVFWVA